jgi:uncharacterized protein (DUF488 family)
VPQRLFTIGHSALALADFLGALHQHEVAVLADVRSRPASARFPHFDGIELEQSLRAAGMRYLFLGEELGGRPEDPNVYRNDGLVNYRARRRARGFQAGIERVVRELEGKAVALMCAEEDPSPARTTTGSPPACWIPWGTWTCCRAWKPRPLGRTCSRK